MFSNVSYIANSLVPNNEHFNYRNLYQSLINAQALSNQKSTMNTRDCDFGIMFIKLNCFEDFASKGICCQPQYTLY